MQFSHHLVICALFLSTNTTAFPNLRYQASELYIRGASPGSASRPFLPPRAKDTPASAPHRKFLPAIRFQNELTTKSLHAVDPNRVRTHRTLDELQRMSRGYISSNPKITYGWVEEGDQKDFYEPHPVTGVLRHMPALNPSRSPSPPGSRPATDSGSRPPTVAGSGRASSVDSPTSLHPPLA